MSGPEVKCFHVNAGKPCTRYVEGAEGERKAIAEWLGAIPEHVLDDWGLNSASKISQYVADGTAAKGAHYWLKRGREEGSQPSRDAEEPK